MARAQKPINPFKVAGKMIKSSISKTKDVVNKVNKNTSSNAPVTTGKSRVNTKLLDAATRNLPNVTVKAKKKVTTGQGVTVTGKKQPAKKTYGESKTFTGGRGKASTYYASSKSIPADSAKFMQQMAATNPAAARSFEKFMKAQQAKNPGASFKFGAVKTTSAHTSVARPGEKPTLTKGKRDYAEYYTPRVTTVLPNKKKK